MVGFKTIIRDMKWKDVKEGHEMDFDNIKILDRASNDLKLQYKEMLFIRKLNPFLNK